MPHSILSVNDAHSVAPGVHSPEQASPQLGIEAGSNPA
jgi:hypothetical protein